MTQQLDERKIIDALTKVATIDGNSDIVTAGAVSGVVIKDCLLYTSDAADD